MLHPAAAHFAVALPIISLVLGLLYLFKPTEIMSKISSRFLSFAAIFVVLAYFTGKNDAKEVIEFLSSDAKAQLIQHAQLGLYLALSMTFIALIKMFACYKRAFKVEILAVLLLAAVTAATFYQGKMGGELTYTYGAHVKGYAEGQTCIAEAKEMEEDEDEDEEEEE
ncbi:MAG: DUF2231 domain-containing protein [Sulfurimonas sp.]|nr:DUF2231 domain-containing protein [Sulfurimonas sp.]